MSNMKAKTSFLVLGLFTIAGAVTVSCGGSSDSDDDNTSAGTTGKAGTTGNAGSSSSAGTTSNNGGTSNAGSTNNNGGTNNGNNGGTSNGGTMSFPSFGGAGFEVPGCDAGTKTGSACTAGEDQACQLNDTTYCGCQGTTWTCIDTDDLPGAGGGGSGFGQATCPAAAQTGDTCSNGPGLCPDQQCICGLDDKVTCAP
jgi:hypothetical protein